MLTDWPTDGRSFQKGVVLRWDREVEGWVGGGGSGWWERWREWEGGGQKERGGMGVAQ